MRLALAALVLTLSAVEGLVQPARASALRDAAQAVIMAREQPADEGRRAALSLAFDAARPTVTAEAGLPTLALGPRRNWFHRKPQALPREESRLSIPELPAVAGPTGFSDRAVAALSAAFAPWRALADAAWGGTWGGMVAVGLAETQH